jgi:hypothetical protein
MHWKETGIVLLCLALGHERASAFLLKKQCMKGREACCRPEVASDMNPTHCCGESFHFVQSFEDCPESAQLVPSVCNSPQMWGRSNQLASLDSAMMVDRYMPKIR